MVRLNYNHLRYFQAVAHDGNLTRAAERMNLSQSALSIQIKKLEDQLGHALFERRNRQLVLTEAGRIALDHADSIFDTGNELMSVLSGEGQTRQILRVGALATLSRNFQLEFLEPVLGHPEIELVLRSGGPAELLQELATLNIDVVLTNQPPAPDSASQFEAHRLAEQSVSLVGMPSRKGIKQDLAALLSDNAVIVPTLGSGVRTGFDALVDRLGIRPVIAAEVDDVAMMRLLARAGEGLAVLSPIAVKDELEQGLLTEFHNLPSLAEAFYAVTIRRRFPNPLVGRLLAA